MVSVYGFDAFGEQRRDDSSYQVDVTRVASNIVTGVGFLGGGAIVKYGASVRGLTTAASIWVTAAIGLAVGLGTYFIATVTTAALLVSLQGLRRPRRWLRRRLIQAKETVTIRLRSPADVGTVVAALHEMADVEVRSVSVKSTDEEIVVEADLRSESPENLQVQLAERSEVAEVDQSE